MTSSRNVGDVVGLCQISQGTSGPGVGTPRATRRDHQEGQVWQGLAVELNRDPTCKLRPVGSTSCKTTQHSAPPRGNPLRDRTSCFSTAPPWRACGKGYPPGSGRPLEAQVMWVRNAKARVARPSPVGPRIGRPRGEIRCENPDPRASRARRHPRPARQEVVVGP